MAAAYSNGSARSSSFHHHNHTHYNAHHHQNHSRDDSVSVVEEIFALVQRLARRLWAFWQSRGRRMALNALLGSVRQLRRNLQLRRLLSFPHLLVCFWAVLLLWGERWVFHTRVENCRWSNWENWVSIRRGFVTRDAEGDGRLTIHDSPQGRILTT
jgi:ethanolamine phosphate phosphodiesterase